MISPVSRGPSKQGRRYDVPAIFVVRRMAPAMQKRVIFALNVLRGIRDASKIHDLQQGNKIACPCPNYSTDMCFCARSLVVPALNASTARFSI